MKKISLIVLFFFPLQITAQNWAAICNLNNPVNTFFEDTILDELFFGGTFSYINSDTMVGIAKWNGSKVSTLGCGVEWDCITPGFGSGTYPVNGIVRFDGNIYTIGSFYTASGISVNGLAIWNGTQWDNIGTGLKTRSGNIGIGNGVKVINNELYVYGSFDSISGLPVNSIAKFDGANWNSVHNFPLIPTSTGSINNIFDVEIYNNELYVCGIFHNLPVGTIYNIIKWNGNDWVSVGDGIRGGFVYVNKMLVFKNELIVAGKFSKTVYQNNPGENIGKWNGIQWTELGNGTDDIIRDIKVHNDTLYACGAFRNAGGIPADRIAKWDGTKWCGLGTMIDNVVGALCFYHDTLYIGGGFWTINGDSISRLAKWVGGNYIDTCGNTTSIDELDNQVNNILIFPNPFSDYAL